MSFPRYSAYKSSGTDWLGQLPSHWTVRKFRYLFRESTEKIKDNPVGQMLSVSGYRGIEVKEYDDENRRRLDGDLVGYRIVRPGQLVVNTMWLNYAGLGVSDYEGHVSPAYRSYWIDNHLDRRFIHFLMRSSLYVQGYTRLLTGIRPNSLQMSREDLQEFPIIVPPVEDQRAIVHFLDRETRMIDALIAEQERLIGLLKEKRQAVISHGVTNGINRDSVRKHSGIDWIGEIPQHWTICEVRRVVTQIEQGWSPECLGRPAELGEWGVLKTGCVNYGRFSEQENKALPQELTPIAEYEVRSGDVIMSRANGSPELVGSTAIVGSVRPRLMLSDKLFRIRVGKDVDPCFFVAVFNAKYMRAQIERAISGAEGLANNLPQSALKSLVLALPPAAEQVDIVKHIEARREEIDRLSGEAARCIGLARERRSALISAAVTGQIDVRTLSEQKAA